MSGSTRPGCLKTYTWFPEGRYIVFPDVDDSKLGLVTKDSPLSFERCGVREDTPEVRRELEKGFAQNDTLRP